MAINLNDNIKVLGAKPTDARYLNVLTPYATVAAANAGIGSTYRYIGLTVNVNGVEYWYGAGILDTDLVVKDSGLASTGITSANNGLTKVGATVKLGGNITGNTFIDGGYCIHFGNTTPLTRFSVYTGSGTSLCVNGVQDRVALNTDGGASISVNGVTNEISLSTSGAASVDIGNDVLITSTSGATYAANYSANFKARSLVDAAYVTGLTSASASDACAYAHAQDAIVSGATLSAANQFTTTCASNCTITANNGLTKTLQNIRLGGALTTGTTLSGSVLFGVNATTLNLTGSTVNLGGTVALKSTPSGSGTLLCRNVSTGNIELTSLSAFGGITGGTNGISICANDKLGLGGSLCANTVLNGCKLTLGDLKGICLTSSGTTDIVVNAKSNGAVILKSQSGVVDTDGDFTNAIGLLADFNGTSGFALVDNRAGALRTGIVYGADYSLNYAARSLVDKGYVDSVATGLNVHGAVKVATTGPITLANTQTIDGIVVSAPDRVLVKNQASGQTNGIYVVVDASAWTRATDYDGTPSGEVSNGDLIPVTTGSTQNNSLWALTTLNPITVGTSVLDFSLFGNTIDVQGGQGIAISQVGGVHTVCTKLGNNSSAGCGLAVTSNGLCIDSNIAGNALSYAAGVLNVNACNCGTVSAINVGYNTTSDALVVACADLVSALGTPINAADNGLRKVGSTVKLGGALTTGTTITLASDACALTFIDTAATKRGIVYGGDYSSTFGANSLVTAKFVTGLTSTAGIAWTGSTANGLATYGSSSKVCSNPNITFNGSNLNQKSNIITNYQANVGTTADDDLRLITSGGSYQVEHCSTGEGRWVNIIKIDNNWAKSGDVFIGWDSGKIGALGIGGGSNTGIGSQTLCCLTTGFGNTGIGNGSINDLRSGCYNVSVGENSGHLLQSGSCNTYIGSKAGTTNIIGNSNVFIGFCAGYSETGSNKLYISNKANKSLIYGEFDNEKLCVRGKLYVSGLTNSTNSNVIYYDSSTKELTYGTAPSSTITGATNGLTKVGQQVKLGGALTGDTTICGASAHSLNLGVLTTNPLKCVNAYASCCINLDAKCVSINGGYSILSLNATSNIFDDFQQKGLVYRDNYSANFTARSLVDAAYVTGLTSTSSAYATNGLNKNSGNCIGLGGALTGLTSIGIDQLGANLRISGLTLSTTSFGIDVVNYDPNEEDICSKIIIGEFDGNNLAGNSSIFIDYEDRLTTIKQSSDGIANGRVRVKYDCVGLYSEDATKQSRILGDMTNGVTLYTVNLATTTENARIVLGDGTIVISGAHSTGFTGAQYAADYSTNFNARSLVDKGYVDGLVAQSSLGEKNNIYAMTVVTGSTTLATGSTYVQLINSVSATTITLPATPINGQVFRIKDAGTGAMANNITVARNGNLIDGIASDATINNDDGALELVFNTVLGSWFVFSFVNDNL